MNYLLDLIQEHRTIASTVSVVSLAFFVGSLVFLPILVSRLPENYFTNEERLSGASRKPLTPVDSLLIALKNSIGIVLILAGIAMLVLPGQGLLTILAGFSLTNFPGKYTLERKIISNPAVFKSLNWIRHKAGKTSLQFPS